MATEDIEQMAQRCMAATQDDSMPFPEIVQTLMEAGFEGYAVDFRSRDHTFYHSTGSYVRLDDPVHDGALADSFDAAAIRAAIGEAQALVPGYTYAGFCRKVRAAGCAGYHVSFVGRRAVYYGKTAECHVEHFPQ